MITLIIEKQVAWHLKVNIIADFKYAVYEMPIVDIYCWDTVIVLPTYK